MQDYYEFKHFVRNEFNANSELNLMKLFLKLMGLGIDFFVR